MNKKFIVILIIILIIAGGGYYFLSKKGGSSEKTSEESKPIGPFATAQEETLNIFGQPGQFAITYLPQEGENGEAALVRSEIWFYPQLQKQMTFLSGYLVKSEDYVPEFSGASESGLEPEDFYYDMAKEDVSSLVGSENFEPVDYLPGFFEEGQFETYLSDKGIFIFEEGKLTYAESFGLGAETSLPELQSLKTFFIKEAMAKKKGKNIFQCIGQACRFIVNLPDKATSRLGPVFGPIASVLITKNIARNPQISRIFRHASQVDRVLKDVEEQKKLMAEVKKMYQDAANELDKRAQDIKSGRDDLRQKLLSGEITFADYKQGVIELDQLVKSFEDGAQKFRTQGDRVNLGNIVKMLGRSVVKNVLGQARQIVFNQIGEQIKRLIDPAIINVLIAQDERGLDGVLDLLLSGDLDQLLQNKDTKGIDMEELKRNIREEIKQMLKDNKEDLQKNWKQKIKDITDRMLNKMKEEKKKIEKGAESSSDEGATICEREPQAKDGNCPSGYKFSPQSGISCIQANCYPDAIPNAHWSYEGYCVCGSSGSIAEKATDPNKECALPSDCGYCPGCVYACVGLNEECPPIPRK